MSTEKGREMRRGDEDQEEVLHEDSLRATLLNLALRTFGDDFLELVDRTGPHKQSVDASIWTTDADDAEGKETELHAVIAALQHKFTAMGMRAVLVVASEDKLMEEQRLIRKRLYGGRGEA